MHDGLHGPYAISPNVRATLAVGAASGARGSISGGGSGGRKGSGASGVSGVSVVRGLSRGSGDRGGVESVVGRGGSEGEASRRIVGNDGTRSLLKSVKSGVRRERSLGDEREDEGTKRGQKRLPRSKDLERPVN